MYKAALGATPFNTETTWGWGGAGAAGPCCLPQHKRHLEPPSTTEQLNQLTNNAESLAPLLEILIQLVCGGASEFVFFENPPQVILMYSQIGEHLNSDPVAYLVL